MHILNMVQRYNKKMTYANNSEKFRKNGERKKKRKLLILPAKMEKIILAVALAIR